jgi:hypothetical protein
VILANILVLENQTFNKPADGSHIRLIEIKLKRKIGKIEKKTVKNEDLLSHTSLPDVLSESGYRVACTNLKFIL